MQVNYWINDELVGQNELTEADFDILLQQKLDDFRYASEVIESWLIGAPLDPLEQSGAEYIITATIGEEFSFPESRVNKHAVRVLEALAELQECIDGITRDLADNISPISVYYVYCRG